MLVVKHVSVADVGKALNPAHDGRTKGAAIMGLGHTLMEHLIVFNKRPARIVNLGALDYRIPTTKDVPLELHSYVIENEDEPAVRAEGPARASCSPAVSAAWHRR